MSSTAPRSPRVLIGSSISQPPSAVRWSRIVSPLRATVTRSTSLGSTVQMRPLADSAFSRRGARE